MNLIYAPLLTEKVAQSLDSGQYVLTIADTATKQSIRQELKRSFDLEAISIRIVNLPAKKVKFKRIPGIQAGRRKAYVQLKKGQKLPGFELPKQKEEKAQKAALEEKK